MDGSFLSQPDVIAASRQFVCVRLTTYENADEVAFLKSFQVTRSGEVENTVFTILAPDGRRELVRSSRSARGTFRDAQRMADAMNRIAAGYTPAKAGTPPLPLVANVRLALDVAACDNQPLVLLFAADAAGRQALEDRLRPLAWGDRFLGRFVYAATGDPKDLTAIEGARPEAGAYVVQPDKFGQTGKVLAAVAADALKAEVVLSLEQGEARFRPEGKTFRDHVRAGHRQGMFWDTALPVTDPLEIQARERGRRQFK